jgi:hypothetical protein
MAACFDSYEKYNTVTSFLIIVLRDVKWTLQAQV